MRPVRIVACGTHVCVPYRPNPIDKDFSTTPYVWRTYMSDLQNHRAPYSVTANGAMASMSLTQSMTTGRFALKA